MAKRKKTGDDDWMEGSWDVLEEENELELLRHLFSTKHVYALQEVAQFHHQRLSEWLSTYVRTVNEDGDRPVSKIDFLGFQVDQSKLSNKTRKSTVQFASKDCFDQEIMDKMADNKLKKGSSVVHHKKIQTNSSNYLFCPASDLLTTSKGISSFWTTPANTYKICSHPTPINKFGAGEVKELNVKRKYSPEDEVMLIEISCSDGGPTAKIFAQRAKRPFIKL